MLRQQLVENERTSCCVRTNLTALQARHDLLKDEMREQKALSERAISERNTAQEGSLASNRALGASRATEEEATTENKALNLQVDTLVESVRGMEEAQEVEQRHNDEVQALNASLGHAQDRLERCETYIRRVYESSGQTRPQGTSGYSLPWTEVIDGLLASNAEPVVPPALQSAARSSVTLPHGGVRASPAAGAALGRVSPPTTLEALQGENLRYRLFQSGLVEQIRLFVSAMPELLRCIVPAEGLTSGTLAELRDSRSLPEPLPRGVSFDASPPPVIRDLNFSQVPPVAAVGSADAVDPASIDVEMNDQEGAGTPPSGNPPPSL
jgi:hypothetical protein